MLIQESKSRLRVSSLQRKPPQGVPIFCVMSNVVVTRILRKELLGEEIQQYTHYHST